MSEEATMQTYLICDACGNRGRFVAHKNPTMAVTVVDGADRRIEDIGQATPEDAPEPSYTCSECGEDVRPRHGIPGERLFYAHSRRVSASVERALAEVVESLADELGAEVDTVVAVALETLMRDFRDRAEDVERAVADYPEKGQAVVCYGEDGR